MYQCIKCRTEYDDSYVDDWGSHPESHGMGQDAVCTNLIEARGRPALPDGSKPMEVCRGRLSYSAA